MATLTERTYEGDVVLWFEPYYSVDVVTIASGADLTPGHVLGKITASGKWQSSAPGAVDGSETPAGVLLDEALAGSSDVQARVLTRLATVANHGLVFDATINTEAERIAARASLASAGIVTRI